MKKFFKYFVLPASLILILVIGIFGYNFYVNFDLPDVSQLKEYSPPVTSKIYSRDGKVLMETGREKRELVQLGELPQILVDAFIAAEDSNFYHHNGVHYLGMIRAAIVNLRSGRIAQGGSTITQQVAKSLLLTNEKTFTRKFKDIILAQEIEKKFTKDEILYMYLNQVYFGGGYYGVKAAIKGYFEKEIKDVTVAEAALIAGLLVAPGRYSPYLKPKFAKQRQTYVLSRLLADKKISAFEHQKALEENIRLRNKKKGSLKATYFTEWIRKRIVELVGKERFLTEGFEIQTTVSLELQELAEKSLERGVREIDKRQGFKGPIKSIGEADIASFIIEAQNKFLKSSSNFSYFTPEGERKYELELNQGNANERIKKINTMIELDNAFQTELKERFVLGNSKQDFKYSLDILKSKKDYEAVILAVNDKKKLLFVDVGGIRGVIPERHHNWARTRKVSAKRENNPNYTKLSQYLKVGDVVHVRVDGEKSFALNKLVGKKKLKSSDFKGLANKQVFRIFRLEQEPDVQASLVSVDPDTGEILAMVGGTDFSKSQFNRAIQSKRQPGSAFKPFVYAAALEEGYTPVSKLLDTPQALDGVDENLDWKPRNYDGQFKGFVTFRKCLEQSRNVPTVTLLRDMGLRKTGRYLKKYGFDLNREIDLSIALGSFGFTLLDITNRYSMFPNGGYKVEPRSIISIKDQTGKEYELEKIPENNKERIYDPQRAYVMTQLLKGVIQRGTGTSANYISRYIGGKTGTTNDYIDAWFIGFSKNIVTGVWTGSDDNKTLGYNESGGKAALPIWIDFMEPALKVIQANDFDQPQGIVNLVVDAISGKPTSDLEDGTVKEYFVKGTEPGGEFSPEKKLDEKLDKLQIIEDEDYFDNQ